MADKGIGRNDLLDIDLRRFKASPPAGRVAKASRTAEANSYSQMSYDCTCGPGLNPAATTTQPRRARAETGQLGDGNARTGGQGVCLPRPVRQLAVLLGLLFVPGSRAALPHSSGPPQLGAKKSGPAPGAGNKDMGQRDPHTGSEVDPNAEGGRRSG